ncbi:MAG: GGDEF domain-containing protein [Pseudanabaenaceae cyanobacterium]
MAPLLSFFRGQVLLVGMPSSLLSALQQGRLGDRHRFQSVLDGETAWQAAIVLPPHVVLSRWSLPDMSAAVLCQRFKASVHYSHLHAVRFLAAMEPQQPRSLAGDLGIDDLLDWPPTLEVTEMRLQNALAIAAYHQHLQKVTGQLQLTQALLTQLQSYDPALRLFARSALELSLENALKKARPETPIALLLLDIDRFEELESTYSAEIARGVLEAVAGRLQNQAAPHSLVYRFEPSVLACVLTTVPPAEVPAFAEGLRRAIQDAPVVVQGLRLSLSLSIGVGWSTTPNPQAVIAQARQALAQAQFRGDNPTPGG